MELEVFPDGTYPNDFPELRQPYYPWGFGELYSAIDASFDGRKFFVVPEYAPMADVPRKIFSILFSPFSKNGEPARPDPMPMTYRFSKTERGTILVQTYPDLGPCFEITQGGHLLSGVVPAHLYHRFVPQKP